MARVATSRRVLPVAAVVAATLAGCALQDPPSRDELNRDAFVEMVPPGQWAEPGAAAGPVEAGWLAAFADERLDALVAEALARNPDLRVAGAQVEQAAAYVRIAGGSIYPAVNLLGKTSGGDGSGAEPLNAGIVSASWELDVWGRVRYGARAAEDQFAAAEADYAYARQSLAALVVRGWVLATEAELQRQLAAESLAAAEKLLSLARDRQRVGIGSELEVRVAAGNAETFRDIVRQLEFGTQQALRGLELVVGRYPSADLEAATALPQLTADAPAGVPSELLERRPDVIAAERRVAAAFSRTRQAEAARLPQFTLSATGSYLDSDVLVLQDIDNPIFGLGLGLVMPLYAGGALKAQVELRTAEQKEAVARYASVGLKAFGEVEGALSAERTARERQAILAAQLGEGERALELENVRYRVGSTDLRNVAQQQLAVYGARSSLLRLQAERVAQRVALYLALGGGFEKSQG
ncbi:MAG: efflux transporter outer membrane subunit [Steroidobacteraceae bacterium]|jgi:NodT family efflux transporter outer membrane factor (OMF) lipoprotein|nr:efflux transporter outer membrane subunit [Steroidobacteraceae bacterium]